MDDDTPWRAWVHAALVHDLSAHLVGHAEAIDVSRKVATDIGNNGHVWSLDHYTPVPPAPAQAALDRARRLLSPQAISTLQQHRSPRPTVAKSRRALLAPTPLLDDVDAPAALAAWDLLHPGATKAEIQNELLVGSIQKATEEVFAADNPWVGRRVSHLQRQARGLATRKRTQRSKGAVAVVKSN